MDESWEKPHKTIAILKYSLIFFKLHFMWPLKDDPKSRRNWKRRFTVVSMGGIVSVTFGLLSAYIATLVNAKDVLQAILAEMSSIAGCTYMYVLMPSVQKEMASALVDLADYSKFGKPPQIFYRTRKWVDVASVCNYMFSLVAVVAHSILKVRYKPHCENDRHREEWYVICGLFSDLFVPFEVTSDVTKYIIHAWQLFFFFVPLKGAAQLSFTLFEVSQYLKVRMQHLRGMLLKMFDGGTPGQQRINFVLCVQYHQEVIQVAKRIDECYRQVMFVHIVMTGFVFGSIGNLIIQNHSAADMAHLLAWVIALQVVCAGGQDIINESSEINWAMWSSGWYNVECKLQKDFMFMLKMSHRPLCLHAGKFGILSHELFGGVIRTSYSIITLLRR